MAGTWRATRSQSARESASVDWRGKMTLAVRAMMIWMVLVAVATSQPTDSVQELRMAAPNIAGMLFPDNSQRVVFGTSPLSTLLSTSYTTLPTLSSCPDAFCLNIVTTSTFVLDPLVLDRYEALYPVNSQTFDPLSPNMVRPMLQGSADGSAKTLWQFSTTDPVNRPISLLLVFKQQSQRASRKDQLLIHITANPTSENSVATTVEIFNRYGNQQVRHKVTLIDKQTFQIALTITMNSAAFDAVISNSNPPVLARTTPVTPISWTYAAGPCLDCTARLFECTVQQVNTNQCNFETSNATLIECLRTTAGLNHVAFSQMLSGDVGSTTSLKSPLSTCFTAMVTDPANAQSSMTDRSWWKPMVSLGCLATSQCPFGPLNGFLPELTTSQTKMLGLTNTTAYTLEVHILASTFTGHFIATFGATAASGSVSVASSTFSDQSTQDDIRSVINATIESLAVQRIDVEKTYSDTESKWTVQVTLWNILMPDFALSFRSDGVTSDETTSSPNFVALEVANVDSTKLVFSDRCLTCNTHFSACAALASCRQVVLPCVATKFRELNWTEAEVDPVSGTSHLQIMPLISDCIAGLQIKHWDSLRQGLLCRASLECPVAVNQTDLTMLRVTDGLQRFSVPTSTMTRLFLSRTAGARLTRRYRFYSDISSLPKFLSAFILENGGDVKATIEESVNSPGRTDVSLSYSNLLRSMPSIWGPDTVSVENVSTSVFLESPQASEPSFDGFADFLDQFENLPPTPTSAPPSWYLASDCQSCHSAFYGCSVNAVGNRTCDYNTASSVLVKCFRQVLPSSTFDALLNATGPAGMEIPQEVAQCFDAVIASASRSLEAKFQVAATLSCYAATQCPFGPLSAVQEDKMAVMTVTEYVQLVRIRERAFVIQFLWKFGNDSVESDAINETMTVDAIQSILSRRLPTRSTVRVSVFRQELGGAQWTLELRYQNLVYPGFQAGISLDSTPLPLIESVILDSTPILSTAPRNEQKVSHQPITPAPVSSSNIPVPSSPSPALSSVTLSDCATNYLDTCRQSLYCQNVTLPCIVEALQLPAPTPDMSVSQSVFDFSSALRYCASSGPTSPVLFDWWEPIQDFFACASSNNCVISGTGRATTTVSIQQGRETFLVARDSNSDVYTSLTISPPSVGSNFYNPFTFSGNASALSDLLLYITQDTARGMGIIVSTNTTISGDETQDTIVVQYPARFLGEIPVVATQSQVQTESHIQPRLLFQSSGGAPDWSGLLQVMSNAASYPTTAIQCAACESLYLTTCADDSNCINYVLNCLISSWVSDTPTIYVDKSLSHAMRKCNIGLPLRSMRPIARLLKCYENSQCPLNAQSQLNPTYLHTRRGVIGLRVSSPPMDRVEASVWPPVGSSFGSSQQAQAFFGTITDLKTLLEAMTDGIATVTIEQSNSTVVPGSTELEITFDSYYDDLPVISGTKITVLERTDALAVARSTNGSIASLGQLIDALSRFQTKAPCSVGCSLDDCLNGASPASLYCRERVLPCVFQMLQAMSNQDSAYDHITSQFNVTSVIQTCAPHLSLASWKAILAFMSCYGQHKCPINTPASSSVATYVNVIAGQQILLVPTGDQISVTITPPTNTDLTNNQAFVGTVDELRSLLQNTILEGASVVNVAASELVPGKTRLAIDYVQYGGSLPDIAGAGVTTVSSVLPQLLFQGSSRKVFWDSLQASLMSAISAASARKQQCASCVNMNLAGGQLSSFLPAFVSNLTQSQGVTTINQGTGVDFSSVIETVTHGLTVATWRPFGRYLICLMMNGCLVSALDIPGLTQETFVILEDPYEFITASVESVVTISGSSAWGSQLTVQSSTAVLDNSTGYGEFKQALQTFINQVEIGGGIVDVSEMPYDGADGTKKLKVMYRDYYGTMPVLSGNDLVSISRTPARSYFQALGGSPSWTQLSDQLSAFVSSQGWQQPTPTPSPAPVSPAVTRVLSGNCASCGLGLYECTLDSVGSGACSFSSTTSLFMACLSGQLPASKFSQLLSGGLVIPYDVHDVLATCFSAVEEVDSSSGASIEEMNWYKASEGLACFEGLKCPFGPLGSAIANSEMAVITSTATTMAWWITSDHFTAQFVIIVAGGEKTTDAFTDLTDKNDIAALVAAKLPTSVEFTVNVILFPAQNAVEVDITCRYLYAPDFQMYMLIDGERKSSVATTRGEFKLDVIALDSSTVQTLSVPAPATPAPVVPASNTPPPVVPEPDTPAPVAPAPDTPAPVAPSPDTPAPVAPAPDTPIPVAPTPDTPAPVAPAPDTPPPVVPEPDTPAPVAPTPDTPAPVAPSPDTPAPVAPAPDTPVPVAPTPDTPAPDTPAPVAPAPDTPAPVTPSVTRVLSGSCASCGLALYECIAETLASGACSYLSANAATVSCLARELPATTFTQLLSGALGAPYDVLSALTTCFSEVEDTDVSSGLGMEETNWYKASEGLACFEGFKCPFGPLDSSIANNEMVVIKSTATVMKWWITSDHFTAKFAISVAGFDIETDPFTDLTDKNDIVALVAVKLPPSVEFTVNVIPFPAQNAVEVDITCHYLYAADLEIYMVIDGALKSPVDSTLGGFSLDVMALDTSAVVM